MEKNEYFSNFKCYYKNKRVAVFGYKSDEDHVKIVEILCNINDQFSKKVAKTVFENLSNLSVENGKQVISCDFGVFHPNIYNIRVNPGDTSEYTFKKHCANQYYKKCDRIARYHETILFKDKEKSIVLKSKKLFKMDSWN